MFRNYFIIAIRHLRRNLNYATLNIIGLTLSIAACLIIFLITRNELTFDTYHRKADRTYRVTMNALDFNPSVSLAIAPAMRSAFPELENVSQYWHRYDGLVKVGNERYMEKDYSFADGSFTNIFDYEWLSGNPQTALSAPNTVVLTESVAHRYFGNQNALGKTFQLDNRYLLTVTGVIKDLPPNTSTTFGFLASFATVEKEMKDAMSEFYAIVGANTFVVVPPHYDIKKIESRLPGFIKQNWGAAIAAEAKLLMQPLNEVHFDQRYIQSTTTSRNTYRALIAIAIFIIVTACINFINLATAQAMKRARETSVRKVLGAHRFQLIRQFLGETSVLVLTTVVLGLGIAYLALPQVASWLDVHIGIAQLNQPLVYVLLAALTLIIILLAGLYPAFVQSSFQPAVSLKSTTGQSSRGLTLRKSLVFVQFLVSQVLIIGTLVVAKQMDFFKNQDLGFNKEAVISFGIPDGTKREVLEQQLKENTGIKEMSFSTGAPSYNQNFAPFSCPERGITKDDVVELKFVDEHFMKMFDMKMLAGEGITPAIRKDSVPRVVVNEALIRKLGIARPEDALGLIITQGRGKLEIKGVVKDFQSESKHKEKRPCILFNNPRAFNTISVRLYPQHMPATIARIEKGWSALFPDDLFAYEFLDDHIAAMYKQEQKLYTAYRLFSGLAIIIGCLGLYGLVAFAAVQRNKEIGIRKVLGASIPDIVVLFGKEFMLLIALAFLVATPLSYYLMYNWLGNFAYHISLSAGIFIVAIVTSVLIAAVTIAHQSIKAALSSPLKSLRTE
ncbi:ABC transporter permease [Chitinophaga filiformis]|uniref:FtsX-like permease family protein n=1 Tax=Chitinophaga filiformis TaxID=104663 RepID=A0A1G7LNU0_CHIFI|nr:ABC transporter permease [Chitinophaga filiformis]SDF50629.1 FtsX-like permease family protein [Chitinophaga filiformis]